MSPWKTDGWPVCTWRDGLHCPWKCQAWGEWDSLWQPWGSSSTVNSIKCQPAPRPLGSCCEGLKTVALPCSQLGFIWPNGLPWPSHPASGTYSREIKTLVMADHCTQKLVAMLFPATENNPSSAQQTRVQSSRIPPSSSTTPLQPSKGTECWLPAPTSWAPPPKHNTEWKKSETVGRGRCDPEPTEVQRRKA